MEASDAAAVSDKVDITCATHKGKQFSYCRSCKLVVCEDCSSRHVERKHDVRDAATIANECRTKIQTYRGEAVNQTKEEIVRLSNLQDDVQAAANKSIAELISALDKFVVSIREKALEHKRELEGAIAGLIESLSREALCSEYDSDLALAEKVLKQGAEQEELRQLRKAKTKEKYNVKKKTIEALLHGKETIVQRQETFLRNCRDTVDMLLLWERYSAGHLSVFHQQKMLEIQECDEALIMRGQLIGEKLRTNTELMAGNRALVLEKCELNERIEALRTREAGLRSKVAALEIHCNEVLPKVHILEQTVKDRREEISNLNGVIKVREEALKKPLAYAFPSLVPHAAQGPGTSGLVSFQHEQILLQSKLIFIYEPKTAFMNVYHLEMKKSFSISAADLNIVPGHDSVQVKNDLYVTGGYDPKSKQYEKAAFVISMVNTETLTREHKAEMQLAKSQHKLVLLDTDTIYSLGGRSKDKKQIGFCEKYSISADQWVKAPAMNESKVDVAATSFNGCEIYVFGGSKGYPTNTIEQLKTKSDDAWRIVKLASNGGWSGRNNAGCFQVSPNEVLIFGGSDTSAASSDDSFVYNVAQKVISKSSRRLGKKEQFAMCSPVRYGGMMHVVGFFEKDIHVYSMEKQTWAMIDSKIWQA